jgi:hypothetical protein
MKNFLYKLDHQVMAHIAVSVPQVQLLFLPHPPKSSLDSGELLAPATVALLQGHVLLHAGEPDPVLPSQAQGETLGHNFITLINQSINQNKQMTKKKKKKKKKKWYV